MTDETALNCTPPSSEVYYQGIYWNDYPFARAVINQRLTGKQDKEWYEAFYEIVGKRKFKKALFINCGNGWVERQIYQQFPLFEEAVGVDFSETLLEEARAKAAKNELPFRYYACDTNDADFVETGFDLVINHAAGHHIQYIDKVFRAIAKILPPDGYFVNMDYVGPHRNQYSFQQWGDLQELNRSLPEAARSSLAYPDLMTMLSLDPTEAIHSELILPTFKRYFNVAIHTRAGGALAYPLLTHNKNAWGLKDEERQTVVETVMEADGRVLREHPERSMFDFFAGQPNHAAVEDAERSGVPRIEEERREEASRHDHGFYYFPPFPIGQRLILSEGSWARGILQQGFFASEPHGTWTNGNVASLRFSVPEDRDVSLNLRCSPLISPPVLDFQRVMAVVNGHPLPTLVCREGGILSIPLYRSQTHGGQVRITLGLPDASSAKELGITDDSRTLSICLHEVELTPMD